MRTSVLAGSAWAALLGTSMAAAQPAPPEASTPPADHPDSVYGDEELSPPSSAADEAPPTPPVHGATDAPAAATFPPIPPPPPQLFAPDVDTDCCADVVGFAEGRLYLRDALDRFRLYPGGRLRTDFYGTFGAGVRDVPARTGGRALAPQLVLRRVRLELNGELWSRLAFTMGVGLGTQRIGDADPASPGSRFAPALATNGDALPAEVSLSYRFRRWLSFTVGQFNVPFSMSNRTREYATPLMERNLAIRGFVVPENKDIGATVWGELDQRLFAYEAGVFAGDGQNRLARDPFPDVVGRFYGRPLAVSGTGSFCELFQLGLSARYGARDQDYVDYDYPSIASGQGVVLWQPAYTDSYSRLTRVIPSGNQWALGGELRLPFDLPGGRAIDLRGEAYWIANDTREAIDGTQLTNTERFGRMQGVGWYGMVSFWAWGDAFASGEPGLWRPVTVDLERPKPLRRGLEIIGMAAGIAGNYDGASRKDSPADLYTPNANIAVYQLGGAVQYWHGINFRGAINYAAYFAPDSGDQLRNQAVVVDNIARDPGGDAGGGNVHHELSGRVAITF